MAWLFAFATVYFLVVFTWLHQKEGMYFTCISRMYVYFFPNLSCLLDFCLTGVVRCKGVTGYIKIMIIKMGQFWRVERYYCQRSRVFQQFLSIIFICSTFFFFDECKSLLFMLLRRVIRLGHYWFYSIKGRTRRMCLMGDCTCLCCPTVYWTQLQLCFYKLSPPTFHYRFCVLPFPLTSLPHAD